MFQISNISRESLLLQDGHDGTKTRSRQWLRTARHKMEAATSVLVVDGGALGVREYKRAIRCANLPDYSIEFAIDIADIYPAREATLVHSRDQLLPRFGRWMHTAVFL